MKLYTTVIRPDGREYDQLLAAIASYFHLGKNERGYKYGVFRQDNNPYNYYYYTISANTNKAYGRLISQQEASYLIANCSSDKQRKRIYNFYPELRIKNLTSIRKYHILRP